MAYYGNIISIQKVEIQRNNACVLPSKSYSIYHNLQKKHTHTHTQIEYIGLKHLYQFEDIDTHSWLES